jgi:hypothetical protein
VLGDLQLPATPTNKLLFEELWPLYNRVNQLSKVVSLTDSLGSTTVATTTPAIGTTLAIPLGYLAGEPVFWSSPNLFSPYPNTGWYYIGNALANGQVFVSHNILVK